MAGVGKTLLGDLFPLTVLLMIVTLPPEFLRALAATALFPLIVQFRIVTVPPVLEIPPPPKKASPQESAGWHELFSAFPLMVLLSITNVPEL
jgi:hypothetical protein